MIKLTNLKFEKDGQKIQLTKQEAMELYFELHQLFGSKETTYVPYYPVQNPNPPWWWNVPYSTDGTKIIDGIKYRPSLTSDSVFIS